MKKIYLAVILILLVCSSFSVAQSTFDKWMQHVEETYYYNYLDNARTDAPLDIKTDPAPIARIMGYALSLQLKFIRRDSSEHRIWLHLEEKSKDYLVDLCKDISVRLSFSAADAKRLEDRALREFAAATVGFHDNRMAALTLVHQENVPNFFDILGGGTGQQQTNSQNQQQLVDSGNQTQTEVESNNTNTGQTNDPTPDADSGDRNVASPGNYILGQWSFSKNTGEHYSGESQLTIMVQHSNSDPKEYDAYVASAGSWQQDRGYAVGNLHSRFQFYKVRDNGEILFYCFMVDQKKSAEQGRVVFTDSHRNVILYPNENRLSIGRGRRWSRWYR